MKLRLALNSLAAIERRRERAMALPYTGPQVVIERPQGKFLPMLRLRAVVMRVHADRITLFVEGERYLADFDRGSGQGRAQPQNGDQRRARKRRGKDWSAWKLRQRDYTRWYSDTADRRA